MKLSWRKWGVSGMAWVSVLALGGMALAGSVSGSTEPSAWLSPKGAVEGKALGSGEPFEMTVHLQAEPDSSYELAVTYDGDGIGVCQEDSATLDTNPQGKAVFECVFTTVENNGTEDLAGTVTFTVTQEDVETAVVVASLSVKPAEVEEELEEELEGELEVTEEDEETGANHGHCVSYWSHEAKAQGLHGKHKGAFVSSIAGNKDAVAEKGAPDDECDFQADLDAALEAQGEADEAKAAKFNAKEQRRAAKAAGKNGDEAAGKK